jgi:hypothetical protein
VSGAVSQHFAWIVVAAIWLLPYRRIRVAHFSPANNLIAIACGLPTFSYLLLRSKKAHENGQVNWKGRAYRTGASSGTTPAKVQPEKPVPRIEHQKLRTEN